MIAEKQELEDASQMNSLIGNLQQSLPKIFNKVVLYALMLQVIVPKSSVGVIIGKGGETIKRIAAESGAKVQFKPENEGTNSPFCVEAGI